MAQCIDSAQILLKFYFNLLGSTYFPSSSTSAGAFPNFLCSSSSFFFLQSSRVIFFGSSRSTIPSATLGSSVDMIFSFNLPKVTYKEIQKHTIRYSNNSSLKTVNMGGKLVIPKHKKQTLDKKKEKEKLLWQWRHICIK